MRKYLLKNGKLIVVGIAAAVFFINSLLAVTFGPDRNQKEEPIVTESFPKKAGEFTYRGEEGKDALILLKEKAEVFQDASGLVTSINGRKADGSKREFWAFYVNGKQATVGPADYETQDTDRVIWKLEQY